MKDKEKQIEEMAKEMCGNDCEECAKESANFYGQTLEEARNNKCLLKNCAKTLYNAGYRKLPEDSVVLSREEYEKLLARPLETMGDLVISKIKEEKCKCFKEIDYGYRQSKQCYAQKYAAEFNCNGCKRNCEKYPKIGEEK